VAIRMADKPIISCPFELALDTSSLSRVYAGLMPIRAHAGAAAPSLLAETWIASSLRAAQ
jgi:hypothetical protein